MDIGVILQFSVATVMPAIVSAILFKLREGKASGLGYWPWQIICGIVFGAIAICGTEFGIATEDATMNVRDAAPIAAGLFFGGPAGIIAGFIGGIERWFAALWGRGMFTRIACSVGTCAAGIYAALLRKYIFEGRRPSLPMAAATGVVVEVLHLLLVILTNPDDTIRAFNVVRACNFPMIVCNAIAVTLVTVVAAFLAGEEVYEHAEIPDITTVLRSRLFQTIIAAFLAILVFVMAFEGRVARARTESLLSLAILDVEEDIRKVSDDSLLDVTRHAAEAIRYVGGESQEKIDRLMRDLEISELNIVDSNGLIVASNDPALVGFDMASGEQSAEFLDLLVGGNRTSMAQEYRPTTNDANVWRKYAGVRIEGGFLQVGLDAGRFMDGLHDVIADSVYARRVGQDGALIVLDQEGDLVGARSDLNLPSADLKLMSEAADAAEQGRIFDCELMGEEYYAMVSDVEGFRIFAVQPEQEASFSRAISVLIMSYMDVLIFAALFVSVFMIVRNNVVRSVREVNGTLDQITRGDLEAEVDVRNNAEFASLSDDINEMVASLRNAIAEESRRIDQELEYARAIQESALPGTFPPFPEVSAFDIYASMNPAREVGGDFYDFFLIDDHTLGFLIADVSGKGIPASLFMMAAKTELSSRMASGMSLADAVQTANWHLCQGNDAGMFVTAWVAILDYETGELTYVNAGHNPPLLRRNGAWEWLRAKGGPMIGVFDQASFRSDKLTLQEGDELFLYTDGVNEAFSVEQEQFGDDRLEAFLVKHSLMHPRALAEGMRAELAAWAKDAEQSDDITMLVLEYGVAPQVTGSVTLPATIDQLDNVTGFLHEVLRDRYCPISVQNQLDIVLEELFVNVCHYAYRDQEEPGTVTLEYIYNADPSTITVSMSDSGKPFNPIDHADPTNPSSIEEAKIGGLGILMVKRMTDDLAYVYDEGRNNICFVKGW